MSIFTDVAAGITATLVYVGYAPNGAALPYVVARPLQTGNVDVALAGMTLSWDFQFSLYCCAASVEASYNLAMEVIKELDGQRVGNTTLQASMGYTGAQVEGHYESQVTVQLNQGGI